ncbi:exocyst complex component EXO70E2 [Punica granatum]|uniref:Exocyst subunit Exo70 family protein n=2 Tax=Punica granatum TaxID=22663 RepID=A0A218VVF7_PUNGR|nr:exocyst complex component EXO70E2 [Punica granatum]OWM64527.1 hypothetical protein CDL15_Pgr020494 [Punica granatum]PKI32966.1 hypothetical protein CRG98_046640 [Punica granatum]
MANLKSTDSEFEWEGNLIAAAQHIAKAIRSKRSLTEEERKVLVDLRAQLSAIRIVNGSKVDEMGVSDTIEKLNSIQEKIMSWELDQSMIWEAGRDEVCEYMNAVEETQKLIELFESLSINKDCDKNELLRRAHDVLQTAMSRLGDEFRNLLLQNKCSFEPEKISFHSSEDDAVEKGSPASFGASSSFDDSIHRDSMSRASEENTIIDLVHPDVVPDLRSIANLMFHSGYIYECSQAYVHVRKDALEDCLSVLEMERLSIEDVLKMEWSNWHSMAKRWVRAIKVFVRVHLASEKWLSDQIFGETASSSGCFLEVSKSAMLQLLNFGEAVSVGPHQLEKLFCVLDMYEVMIDIKHDIDELFSEEIEIGSLVRFEYEQVLKRLGESATVTFLEVKNAIASNPSATSFASGGVHHLTRYVMNYIKTLTDYNDTLESLLKDREEKASIPPSPDAASPVEEEESNGATSDPGTEVSRISFHFQSIASVLQSNLDEKSNLYRDSALQQLFLMNNVHYIAEKVKNSELRLVFGDDWIKKQNGKFQQHALNYERAAWSSILSLLKDDGLHSPGPGSISKTLLKERFKNFNLSFEEVYRAQTSWLIPDLQLREELRISISVKIVQAYRTFVGRHSHQISDKHIKYSADDLENLLLDLFEGSPKSLTNPHRR